jgi:hypothetical protein
MEIDQRSANSGFRNDLNQCARDRVAEPSLRQINASMASLVMLMLDLGRTRFLSEEWGKPLRSRLEAPVEYRGFPFQTRSSMHRREPDPGLGKQRGKYVTPARREHEPMFSRACTTRPFTIHSLWLSISSLPIRSPKMIAPSWGITAYSITSSARASSVGGTSMPSALAVFRLITS